MTPLRIAEPASRELAAAIRWYEAQRPGLGVELHEAVVASLDVVRLHPGLGPPFRDGAKSAEWGRGGGLKVRAAGPIGSPRFWGGGRRTAERAGVSREALEQDGDVLDKPFTAEALARKVREAFDRSR